ncbi:MAG: 50S ribosomal protein L3 [Patescibacteria group bacterium]
MAFILGKKIKMSQLWENNKIVPVTLIQAGPVFITQIKMKEKDGYKAVQLGFDASKKKINKPATGHLNKLKEKNQEIKNIKFRYLKEFKIDSDNDYKLGDEINVSFFKEGDKVKVSGLNKGKGFQGVVKRHGFGGGPKTHGQKNRHRAPGSIGSTAPQRVMPGRKMAGRMGQERITIKNLKVISIDKENNLLMLKGAVPGSKNTLLEIRN